MNQGGRGNGERVAVMVDSGCDIAPECMEKYGLWLLPLHIDYPEKAYLDGVDIDPQMVYDRYPDDYPKTSTPSIREVLDKLDEIADAGFDKVIAVCISSGLSGTWNAVRVAAEQQDRVEVFVFDSKNISIGSGLLGIWAAVKAAEGMAFEEICRGLERRIYDSKVMFYMDTLEYLKRGGRIGTVSSVVGRVLRIKPLISCNRDGIYYTVGMIRGGRRGKEKLLEEMTKFCRGHRVWIGIGHGAADGESARMEQMLLEALGPEGAAAADHQAHDRPAAGSGTAETPGSEGTAAADHQAHDHPAAGSGTAEALRPEGAAAEDPQAHDRPAAGPGASEAQIMEAGGQSSRADGNMAAGPVEVLYRKQIAATLALNTGPGLVGVGALLDP